MEHLFKAEDWKELSPADRAERCRLMAQEAQKLAKGSPPQLAVHYNQIAQDWLKLADEMASNPTASERAAAQGMEQPEEGKKWHTR